MLKYVLWHYAVYGNAGKNWVKSLVSRHSCRQVKVLTVPTKWEGGGKQVQITEARPANMLCTFLFLSRQYHYLPIAQIYPIQTQPKSLCSWQYFRFSVKIFSRLTLAGWGGGCKNFFFPPRPKPVLSRPETRISLFTTWSFRTSACPTVLVLCLQEQYQAVGLTCNSSGSSGLSTLLTGCIGQGVICAAEGCGETSEVHIPTSIRWYLNVMVCFI